VTKRHPAVRGGGELGILERAVDVDRNHQTLRMTAPVFIHLLPHPSRVRERAPVGHDNQNACPMQSTLECLVELATDRCFVLAEEDGEVALAQLAREVRGI